MTDEDNRTIFRILETNKNNPQAYSDDMECTSESKRSESISVNKVSA